MASVLAVRGPVTRLDALAYEPHFVDHLAPVWRALPESVRGTFYVDPPLLERASRRGIAAVGRERPTHEARYPLPRVDGPPALVASYGDVKEGRRFGYGPFAYIEHGAGQAYGNNRNGSYAGGPDRHDNTLIMVPNEECAERWRAAYRSARVEVVGSPRLDDLPGREGDRSPPTVALSFHWPAPLSISGYAGTAVGDYLVQLPALTEAYHVIGHCHPKGDWPRQMRRTYARYGIEFVEEFDDVCRRADVYVCDNSSTIFEFASTGRPVVLLNGRYWTTRASYGLRFWSAAHVGVNVWPDQSVVDAVSTALVDDDETRAKRDDALDHVYEPRRGGSRLAADAIVDWLSWSS